MMTSIPTKITQSKLYWTGSNSELLHLIKELHNSNNVNYGRSDLDELIYIFSLIFNTEPIDKTV